MYTVTTGNTILAADINQIVNALQRPAGQSETGKYFISAGAANGEIITEYIRTTSQGATPASLVIDTVDQAATNCTAPNTNFLTQFGFQINTTCNSTNNNCKVGGNTTVNY